MEGLLRFGGKMLVTRDEGARLGVTEGLLADDVGRIVGLLFRQKWRRTRRWVTTSDVVIVGRDLVMVSSESNVRTDASPGRRLADYRRCLVCTVYGRRLGRLADVATVGEGWRISRLTFEDGSSLEVDEGELALGRSGIRTREEFATRILRGAGASSALRIVSCANSTRSALGSSMER